MCEVVDSRNFPSWTTSRAPRCARNCCPASSRFVTFDHLIKLLLHHWSRPCLLGCPAGFRPTLASFTFLRFHLCWDVLVEFRLGFQPADPGRLPFRSDELLHMVGSMRLCAVGSCEAGPDSVAILSPQIQKIFFDKAVSRPVTLYRKPVHSVAVSVDGEMGFGEFGALAHPTYVRTPMLPRVAHLHVSLLYSSSIDDATRFVGLTLCTIGSRLFCHAAAHDAPPRPPALLLRHRQRHQVRANAP